MNASIYGILLTLMTGTTIMSDPIARPLFDFAGAEAAKTWQTVNDGVMGGVSEGKFKITDRKTMEFFGTLSLENNGGFASVRARVQKSALEKGDVLLVRLRGDGREYSMNLYVPRPNFAFAYRSMIQTRKDEWMEIRLPLDKFEATSFGRKVPDAGAVDAAEINGLGFLLGDKKAGPFKLEVEWIKVERAGK